MIAAGIAKLVDEGKIEWTTRVQTILPEFVHDNARFARVVTVGDLLAHRSGLDGVAALCLAMQGDGEMLVPNDAFFQTVQHIPWPTPPRQSWSYCVWGYSIAAYIIEKISGRPPHEYLEEELFVPLGMDRTSLQPRFDHLENVAKPYASLTNGNAHLLKHRQQFAGTFFEGSGGAFTTVNDLLLWAKAMLAASQEAKDTEKTIIKQGSHLLGNQISIESTCDSEQSYGFGWVRSQLPGAVGVVGDNADIWGPSELPIFGARNAPQLMIYHQGATVGYYSFLALFPETQSAVVVLTNAIAFSDPAEWIGRIIIQGLFDFAEPIDYVDWSEKSKEKRIEQFRSLHNTLNKERMPDPLPLPLEAYVGRYYNQENSYTLEIALNRESKADLFLSFQGRSSQRYDLRHYHKHDFEWSLTYDQSKERGRYSIPDPQYYKLNFHIGSNNKACRVVWHLDDVSIPTGMCFDRLSDTSYTQTSLRGWFSTVSAAFGLKRVESLDSSDTDERKHDIEYRYSYSCFPGIKFLKRAIGLEGKAEKEALWSHDKYSSPNGTRGYE